jgi:hypothetical protein
VVVLFGGGVWLFGGCGCVWLRVCV